MARLRAAEGAVGEGLPLGEDHGDRLGPTPEPVGEVGDGGVGHRGGFRWHGAPLGRARRGAGGGRRGGGG
ncbi:hypothetical protein GB882_10995 [Georgenia ruanii]|uniref:Uncharacterized protein n=1 Tax=Georgenia ruanii TaxID=348442 RepID=A0A7J9UZS6_9MICO|nr:hypothetical protein [Georgenia ruanii]